MKLKRESYNLKLIAKQIVLDWKQMHKQPDSYYCFGSLKLLSLKLCDNKLDKQPSSVFLT